MKLIRGPMLGTHDGVQSVVWSKLRPPPNMPMPAGATSWSSSSADDRAVVYCSQGRADQPGGLYEMRPGKAPQPVVRDFYGANFGCLCAVVVTDVGTAAKAYWFLDGGKRDHDPGFRDPPELPPGVWRYDINSGLRMMTHDVRNPQDLAMSPDGETLYVTDTYLGKEDNRFKYRSQGAVYAFDVVTRSGAPFLTAKRLFAMPVRGDPAGIVCDAKGHVFVGCSDGVEIFHPDGTLLGVLNVPGERAVPSHVRLDRKVMIC
ncbi:hypothetical protein GE09DRAFT_1095592 [Coniochaeta sp. 2T2.1]|nr:hypothetical protein GE09DRAFT_1095592 [Coniochaeta sp. 2T2.1]